MQTMSREDIGKTESYSAKTGEKYQTDKWGKVVAERTAECAHRLATETDARRVIIHDADTGRIGYVSKRSAVNDRMLEVARSSGYQVDLISATTMEKWTGERKPAVGIEFMPASEVADDE